MPEIRIPKLGLDTTDCDVVRWLVKVGDKVSVGTPLLEVEMEKAVVTLEAEAAGVVQEIRAKPGQTVPVSAVVGVIQGDER